MVTSEDDTSVYDVASGLGDASGCGASHCDAAAGVLTIGVNGGARVARSARHGLVVVVDDACYGVCSEAHAE
jgi:hypothetical protein